MINIAISLGTAIVLTLLLAMIHVHLAIGIPLGLLVGFALFIFLGRKVQERMEQLMAQMQKDIQAGKIDRAIDTLKSGYSLKHRHILVASQLNSQIGTLYFLKKDHDKALEYLKKGFIKHYVGQGMMAVIYFKRKDYETMKKVLEATIQASKKESICYSLYAYLLYQLKQKDEAVAILQKGLKKLPEDEKLRVNLTQLQNNKKMKMKAYGDLWVQFMLERPPRIMQAPPRHMMRVKKKAMFR